MASFDSAAFENSREERGPSRDANARAVEKVYDQGRDAPDQHRASSGMAGMSDAMTSFLDERQDAALGVQPQTEQPQDGDGDGYEDYEPHDEADSDLSRPIGVWDEQRVTCRPATTAPRSGSSAADAARRPRTPSRSASGHRRPTAAARPTARGDAASAAFF